MLLRPLGVLGDGTAVFPQRRECVVCGGCHCVDSWRPSVEGGESTSPVSSSPKVSGGNRVRRMLPAGIGGITGGTGQRGIAA